MIRHKHMKLYYLNTNYCYLVQYMCYGCLNNMP